jgi:hypothetical protein
MLLSAYRYNIPRDWLAELLLCLHSGIGTPLQCSRSDPSYPLDSSTRHHGSSFRTEWNEAIAHIAEYMPGLYKLRSTTSCEIRVKDSQMHIEKQKIGHATVEGRMTAN